MGRVEHSWYRPPGLLTYSLVPLSGLFRALAAVRRAAYRWGIFATVRLPVPVIVVGNLTVGGSGKTPLVIWLAQWLSARGYRVGIVSRGYGGTADGPQRVMPDSDPRRVGDEPVLLAQRCGCAVAVGRRRAAAAQALLADQAADILIADDGLQHYALARDLELVVVDGARRFGNGYCLPAGPLREPPQRLGRADLVICNGSPGPGEYAMRLQGDTLVNLQDPQRTCALTELAGRAVHGVAGIGHPRRFFDQLRTAGLQVEEHAFADHHAFSAEDLAFGDTRPVLMTEKDAVKCRAFAGPDHWYLPVHAVLQDGVESQLIQRLEALRQGRA